MPDRWQNETVRTVSVSHWRIGRHGVVVVSLAGRKALYFSIFLVLCSGLACQQVPRRDSGYSSPKSSGPVQFEPDTGKSPEFSGEESVPSGPELIIPPRSSEPGEKNSSRHDLTGPQLGDPFLGASARLDSWGKPEEADVESPVKLTGEIVEIDLAASELAQSLRAAEKVSVHDADTISDRAPAGRGNRWTQRDAKTVAQPSTVISVNAVEAAEAPAPLSHLGGDLDDVRSPDGPDAEGFWQPLIVPGPTNPANRGVFPDAVPSAPAPVSLPAVEESSTNPGPILLVP